MKSINAKRIAAVAAGAALLGVGLAFAGPVTFQNVAIIGASGQPLVQIVVGSKAQITDGVAAANIAAAIGNLAYTTVGVTASVNATNANSVLHVTVTNPSAVTVTNQQVWLNQTGAAYAAGSYGFSALIGSVLNRGIQVGSPSNTKTLQANQNYAYLESNSLTTSPAPSPYWAATGVPVSTVTKTTGGGVSFTSFTKSSYDNILQITSAQQPGLLSNSGQYGETETIWVTGFPVYNQQIGSFALMSAGGAYQASFAKSLPVSSGSMNANGVTGINNAGFTFLGQNWTIIGFTVPGAAVANSTATNTKIGSTSVVHGGQLIVASSLSPLTTVYVGQNVSSGNGQFVVQLTDIGQPNNAGSSPAAINLYYNGKLTNVTSVAENTTQSFNISGTKVFVKVGQTFAGLYAYQKYAKIQIYSNVFTLKDGVTYNQTYDPGWKVNLLWTNTSSSNGNAIQLQSIIVYNASPTTLKPGQSLSFIQNPSAWNLEFIGDNLGNNYDPMNFKTSSTSSVTYKNTNAAFTQTPTGVNSIIQNVTEPAQFLTVTSGISNAFSYGGQTGSSVTYDLTPYYLDASSTAVTPQNLQVVLSDPGNFVNNNNPLTVTIKGSNGGSSATNASVFTTGIGAANTMLENTLFTNVTSITLSAAYPGLTVTVNAYNGLLMANGIIATLSTISPTVQYLLSGQTSYSQSSGASVNYNQQNGQPISALALAGPTLPASPPTSVTQYFTYTVNEVAVPGNQTAIDSLAFAIYNATSGSGSSPLFWLNASVGTGGGAPGTRNNMTYTPVVANTQTLNAATGFRTERGSSVAYESAQTVTINYATQVDQLLFAVSPSASSPSSSTQRQYGPYSVGQAVSIPGVTNVTVSKITASATLSNGNGYTITGINNLTATPSVSSALQPVWLTNLTTTPLVVLDSQANPASSLVLIGSGYVNTLSQQVVPWSNYTSTTTYLQAFGNKILIAGYSASQTTAAANQFIQDLYAAASSS